MNEEFDLKKAREDKKLTLEQVSKATRIPVDKLKALETGNYDYFHSKFYAKTFLRTYSTYLGISVDYSAILPEDKKSRVADIIQKKRTSTKKSSKRNTLLPLLIILLIAVSYIYFTSNQGKKFGCIFTKLAALFQKEETVAVIPQKTSIMVKGVTLVPTWVRVIADGEMIEESIIKENTTSYWKAERMMILRIGNTKGIKIFYRKLQTEEYKEVDIDEGSRGDVNEIEFFNDPAETQ
jgi:hypothetical protein